MTDVPLPIRKSSLMMYRHCPHEYEYAYIKQFPGIEKDFAMEKGTEFHETAARFYGNIDFPFLEQLKNEQEVTVYLRNVLPKNTTFDVLLDNFATFEAHRWWILKTRVTTDRVKFFKPAYIEQELYAKEMFGIKGPFGGRVDRIDNLTSGEFAVIDLKSGNLPRIVDFRAELAFYASIANAQQFTNPPIAHIGGYSPKNNEWFFERISPHTTTALKRFILKFIDEHEKRTLGQPAFEREIGIHCIYCAFAGDCLFGSDIQSWERIQRSKYFTWDNHKGEKKDV